eukprot:TRINITY_DN33609_c0_g1_i1.p1 TRINITY_DN33609_c0_g1~~TRINITY_DN33609_c0_g1_i1.p1  ORF type:complete len:288 (-),score=26.39 TRINITY_DN33609_c0_g1_i1:431-1294(-)
MVADGSQQSMCVRLLALHGFGGNFGGTPDGPGALTWHTDKMKEALAHRHVNIDIIVPRAPNMTPHGEAWLAGDQSKLGTVVGFSFLNRIVAEEGLESSTPKPLTEEDLPALPSPDAISAEENCWDGVEGYAESLSLLEQMWDTAAKSGQTFDGILGFSQGTLTSVIFSRHLAIKRPDLPAPRFIVLCCGFMRPWPASAHTELNWPPAAGTLTTPSLHLLGTEDTVVAKCRSLELLRLFDPATASVHEHRLRGSPMAHGGHLIPWPGIDGDEAFFDKFASFLRNALGE